MKGEDLLSEICDLAGVNFDQLPQTMVCRWFPMGSTSEGRPSEWKWNEAPPGNPAFLIFALFQDTDEIRVYCIVNASANVPDGKKMQPPRRITLTKISPVMTAENMHPDVFKEEIAKEFQLLAELGADEIEREQIVGWLRSTNQLALAQAIEDGAHEGWEPPDEPDETEPEERGVQAEPAPPEAAKTVQP